MRSKSFIATSAALAVFVLAVIGMVVYDNGRKDLIAKGVTVDGIDVGGLRADEARALVSEQLASPLRKPLKITFQKSSFRLTAEEASVATDVDATVDLALEESRSGNVLTRSVRGLTGGSVDENIDLAITYDRAAVRDVVQRVSKRLEREPVDADVEIGVAGVETVQSVPGREIAAGKLRRSIKRQIVSVAREPVSVEAKRIAPKVTTGEVAKKYPSIVVLNRSTFQVTLYEDLKATKTYTVAIGAAGYDTPVGQYAIQDKQVDPYWNVPDSDWAGSLAGQVIPPGPTNPLKARWMGIYNGAGFHGTDATYSLGTAASHGCVRMAIPDVIDLYDRVDVGTPVYIG